MSEFRQIARVRSIIGPKKTNYRHDVETIRRYVERKERKVRWERELTVG
tara:strand:- start:283 stop:429 length:147 start_codon:yes stop_codon:yes gene_type:complete